jgi:hypothetical protein
MLGAMRRPIAMCAALGAAAAIAGCGGGSKPSSSTTSTTTTTITTRSNATTTASTPTSTSPTATGETSPPTTSTSAVAPKPKPKPKASSGSGGVAPQPPAGGSSHGTKVKKPAGGSASARVPATFSISRGGSVSPPTVSAPAFLAISLTVASGDGEPHRVRVLTLAPHVLNVPSGGRASTLIGGLKAGTYAVQIDGKTRAKLVIGGEPGP